MKVIIFVFFYILISYSCSFSSDNQNIKIICNSSSEDSTLHINIKIVNNKIAEQYLVFDSWGFNTKDVENDVIYFYPSKNCMMNFFYFAPKSDDLSSIKTGGSCISDYSVDYMKMFPTLIRLKPNELIEIDFSIKCRFSYLVSSGNYKLRSLLKFLSNHDFLKLKELLGNHIDYAILNYNTPLHFQINDDIALFGFFVEFTTTDIKIDSNYTKNILKLFKYIHTDCSVD